VALDRALRRGLGLDELRQVCETVNQYRYLRPLRIPAVAGGDLRPHLVAFRSIADELRELLINCAPGDDGAVPVVEGVIEWVDNLCGLGSEAEQEFALLFRPRGVSI
jgi:hypothetical protein